MSKNEIMLIPKGAVKDSAGLPIQVRGFDDKGGVKVLTVCRAEVELESNGGGVTVIQGKAEIDSEGYRRLNRIASLHILTPPTVTVDGKEVGNPHYERNPKTLAIQRVVIRKAVVGPSPLGKQVVVDKTLHFDTAMYLNQAIIKLVTRFGSCGCMGNRQDPPVQFVIYNYDKETKQDIRKGEIQAPPLAQLAFFPVHGEDFGVWLDARHPEVIRMWGDFSQMLQFVSRRAETTVIRLCMQDHPAIGAKKVQLVDGKVKVPVFFHQDGINAEQIRKLEASMRREVPLDGPAGIEVMSSTVDGEIAAQAVGGEADDAASEAAEVGVEDAERGFGD